MADVRLDEGEVRNFLLDPFGEIARMLEFLAERAAQVARGTVQVDDGETLTSIATAVFHGPVYQSSEVSAGGAALFLEKGTKPHVIRSHGKYSLAHQRRDYFGPEVFHPGTRPYPFLTTGLWSLQNEF
jgi:hypothetical protein